MDELNISHPREHLPDDHRQETSLSRIISNLDDKDASSRYREEEADNNVTEDRANPYPSSSTSEEERTIVAWEPNDPENPYEWSTTKKTAILITTMFTIINSTMGSALPSNAVPFIVKEFGTNSETQEVLPMSTYLIGYVFGPIIWAPMSEQFGRKTLMITTFASFCIWTMACALSPNWPALLVFRLLTGASASAPIAVVAGIFADIYGNPITRGRGMAAFMATTLFGPLFAPIISGYCSPTIGWRWSFWIGLIYAGVTMVPLAFLPETYGPVLLAKRARRIRKEDPKASIVAPHELEKRSLRELVTVVLTRPVRMLVWELIVSSTCIYLSLIYAIFYMTFQAYPIIFQDMYGLSPGECGVVFMAVGAGGLIALPIFWGWDFYLQRAIARGIPWTRQEEFRRVPLATIGGPAFVVSLFWLGWTARPDIHFLVPMLAGIPFGLGFMLIFMALLNYITDAYEIFAASANAATSTCRSLLAVVMPLATTPMFARLGIAGACSLLGGLSVLMCAIPFLFIWKGEQIRARSRFCIALRERKEEMARKVEEQRRRREGVDIATAAAAAAASSAVGAGVVRREAVLPMTSAEEKEMV